MLEANQIKALFRSIVGWLCLILFVELGYLPAIFCKNMILLGYTAPASQEDKLTQISMLMLSVVSYASYMAFARLVMTPIAMKRLPGKPFMSRDAAHELNNQRFFFNLMPSFLLIIAMALWDLLVFIPIPGSQAIFLATEKWVGMLIGI